VTVPSNPFRFGPLALDDVFTDRDAELAELCADARNGQDVVVIAPRRFGKTSLVWRAAQTLARDDVLVAQVDLMRTPTKEKLAEKLAETIYEQLATPLFRARERLKVFSGLRVTPTAHVNPDDGTLRFSFGARMLDADIDATIERLLELPAQLAAERDRRIVLVLDEFQEITEIDSGLVRLMRAVFQTQTDVCHLYLGSKRHMMQRIFNDVNEPFWRSAKQLHLGPIPPADFVAFAREQFARTDRTLSPSAAERVVSLTGGHPYATQELLYFLWQATPPKATPDDDDVDRALTAVLRSEHAHFSLLWERLAPTQRVVLLALCLEPGRPLTRAYQARHGLPPSTTVQKALDALIRAEIVERRGRGDYAVAEPFLPEWVAANER
jgi:hypothetical protein